ncbi:MAG: hypothetical protein K2P43_00090, partial [Lachnospiraceae bacterium]|nr:hypothetical protein [Lachnospiraceae bacterium]
RWVYAPETEAGAAPDRVKGAFFNSGQYQIILGTGLVNRVYDEVIKITGGAESGEKKETVVYGNCFQRAIRMFSDVFVPIIPVLVATGLFMGLRGLLTQDAVLGVFGMTPESIPQNFLKVKALCHGHGRRRCGRLPGFPYASACDRYVHYRNSGDAAVSE